jgi:phosphohistidine swiveling domain-containing protein
MTETMTAQVPLVIGLDDARAETAVVGGKGASLARLARAGFRVPPGFQVTTSAYLDFIDRGGLRESVLAAVSGTSGSGADGSGEGGSDAAAARIRELFAGQPVPDPTAAAIAAAYAALGDDVPVAVRSSATVEDLPGMSAAGQHDTYLNVRGGATVLDAVQRCWASLWSARAIDYRARAGVEPGDVSIAVVVQRLVPAEAAGVMFTTDPVSGARDQVVISANWGLGESVVAGDVTPDVAVVGRGTGKLASYRIGSKDVMTVPDGAGTRTTDTPAGRRAVAVLSPERAEALAGTGLAIEKLYGEPVDVEWALAGGDLSVLQARPITARAEVAGAVGAVGAIGVGEEWNDSLGGDYLWTNGNFGEALPDVMTQATWSFVKILMSRNALPSLPGYPCYGRIGGRFYLNMSMSIALERLVGISPRWFLATVGPVFGKLPPAEDIPRPRLPRLKLTWLMIPALAAQIRRASTSKRRIPRFLASSPRRCDQLRTEIEQATDVAALARLWPDKVRPLLEEAGDMLGAAGLQGPTLASSPRKLTKLVGEADAALLLSGQAEGSFLASLGPAVGLARLARGEIDRDAFAREYGHRGPHEAELSIPRPAEDPGWIDNQAAALRDTAHDAEALLAKQEATRAAAWQRITERDPRKAAAARKIVARWAPLARAREAVRSEVVRAIWVVRTWVLRAGQLTGHGDDLFLLELPETYSLLRGDTVPLAAVPARRESYDTYRALPPYPSVIRGRFDPIRWAADPGRRIDYYDEHAQPAKPAEPSATADADLITGFPGAAGVVEGIARVLRTPEDATQLGDGEILVTTVTNIGWTPVFPRAAAVVTDVGAPLSHAAIVAREFGIPAVVGCGDATTRIHSGDRVRVDGGTGTDQVLTGGQDADQEQ